MAIELRGSMFVYLVLVVTSPFTPFYRNTIIFLLLVNSIWGGDILGEVPFYTGALLADMSIVLSSRSDTAANSKWRGPNFEKFQNYWPIGVALFGGFLASYPPNNDDLAAWSRSLTSIGHSILNSDCIVSPFTSF